MRKRKGNGLFEESTVLNTVTYNHYFDRLTELATTMFEWDNLPDTVDPRYIEMSLFNNGCAVFFRDDVIGELCLDCSPFGNFDVYGNPVKRRAYSRYNAYNKEMTSNDSVVIWNNYLRTNSVTAIKLFARKLYNLDRIIDVNSNAQKTPVLVQCSEKQRLTLVNLYKQFDGNEPFIYGDKNLDISALKVLSTSAPYVSDKLYDLKVQIWNEALTYLGISNVSYQKKERLISDEVTRSQGGTIASRYSRLQARREAVEKINDMFSLNILVNYREDFQLPEFEHLGTSTIVSGVDELFE